MPRRWRFRKVTPGMVENMRTLQRQGWKLVSIGKFFNLNTHTVRYWLDEEYKRKCIDRAKRRSKKPKTPEQKQRQKEYIRNYIKERYNKDPEFHERFLSHTKKWQRKKREEMKNA